jgi:hypothetical protein
LLEHVLRTFVNLPITGAVSCLAGDELASRLGQHSIRRALQPNEDTIITGAAGVSDDQRLPKITGDDQK